MQDSITGHKSLQTVGMRSKSMLFSQYGGQIPRSELESLKQGSSFFEPTVRDSIMDYLGQRKLVAESTLMFLSVLTHFSYLNGQIHPDDIQLVTGHCEHEKQIVVLQPSLAIRPASEVKGEMMVRYSNEGYYFLEEYIDEFMEASHGDYH